MQMTEHQKTTELADAAFQEVAKQVIKRSIETKTPVIVWENGAIKRVQFGPNGLPLADPTTDTTDQNNSR